MRLEIHLRPSADPFRYLSKNLNISGQDKRLMDIIVKESNNISLLISDFTQFARP